jgi:hypothetical protein
LFDGIGGFPFAAVKEGILPVWATEIEAAYKLTHVEEILEILLY